jgi:isopropylmalate/homocitrate/citramalate synthase
VTIREGAQAVDASFTLPEKVQLAQQLERVGVAIIQVGHPRADAQAIDGIRNAGVATPLEVIVALSRDAWQRDVVAVQQSRVASAHLVVRVGGRQLRATGLSDNEMLRRVESAVFDLRGSGIEVALGLAYVTEAEEGFLSRVVAAADRLDVSRVILADSLGRAKPDDMARLVSESVQTTRIPIGIHCHNDLGLALASTVAGVEAGASWIDASVAGIGERAGNAALEEVAVCLTVLYDVDCGIRLTELRCAADLLARLTREPINGHRSVVGRNVFATKLDLHVDGLVNDLQAFSSYAAELVGAQLQLRVGAGSGRIALEAKLRQLKVEVPAESLPRLLALIRSEAERDKRSPDDSRLLELVRILGLNA